MLQYMGSKPKTTLRLHLGEPLYHQDWSPHLVLGPSSDFRGDHKKGFEVLTAAVPKHWEDIGERSCFSA